MDKKSIELPYQKLVFEGPILVIVYKEGLKVDLSMVKEMAGQRLTFIGEHVYPSLADIRGLKSITKEARDYLAGGDGIKGISAGAILVNNFISAMISNLYITFSKPPMPTRMFSNKGDAMRWLLQFVSKDAESLQESRH